MSRDKKGLSWLYGELPGLVSEGILTEEAAGRIRERYGEVPRTDTAKIALMIFGVIGALLIGGGIILILAHNWENLGRPERMALAFLPLLCSLAIGAYAVFKTDSLAWKEGAGTIVMLTSGSSIAIIGQTYHLGGDLESFLLVWLLVSLPAIYLFNSTAAALVYIAGMTWRCCAASWHSGPVYAFWPLMLLAIPHLCIALFSDRKSPRNILLLWALVISLTIAIGQTMADYDGGNLTKLAYFGFFSMCYLAGRIWFDDPVTIWLRPLTFAASAGIFLISLFATFDDFWGRHYHWRVRDGLVLFEVSITALFYIALSVFVIITLRRKKYWNLFIPAVAPVAVVACIVNNVFHDASLIPVLIFNAYLIVLGLSLVAKGIKLSRLGKLNTGMAVLTVLIVLRFFEADLSMLIRGLVFIVLGVCFITANFLMVMRRRSAAQKTGGIA